MENLAFFEPIKKAILVDPELDNLQGRDLNKILETLEMFESENSLQEEVQARRNSIFFNFGSEN